MAAWTLRISNLAGLRLSVRRARSTVSVVIPSRNDAAMLKTCLSLLSQQSRPADEIIVVDNSSSDDTADICRAAGVRHIPVDLQGIPATAATGFDAAAGELSPGWILTPGRRRTGSSGSKLSSWPRGRCPSSRDPAIFTEEAVWSAGPAGMFSWEATLHSSDS